MNQTNKKHLNKQSQGISKSYISKIVESVAKIKNYASRFKRESLTEAIQPSLDAFDKVVQSNNAFFDEAERKIAGYQKQIEKATYCVAPKIEVKNTYRENSQSLNPNGSNGSQLRYNDSVANKYINSFRKTNE
jgi:hypothetical protein